MQKKRNPLIHWLLTVFTGSVYGIFWIYKMAIDANVIAGSERIKIKKNVCITIILFVTYLVLFSITMQQTLKGFDIAQAGGTPEAPSLIFFVNWLVGLAWLIHLVSLLIRTANIARTKIQIPSSAVLALLTFIYMIALPLLQSKMNKIEHIQSELDNG
jgi:hypothetical protein